jgi:hypothetical protein
MTTRRETKSTWSRQGFTFITWEAHGIADNGIIVGVPLLRSLNILVTLVVAEAGWCLRRRLPLREFQLLVSA